MVGWASGWIDVCLCAHWLPLLRFAPHQIVRFTLNASAQTSSGRAAPLIRLLIHQMQLPQGRDKTSHAKVQLQMLQIAKTEKAGKNKNTHTTRKKKNKNRSNR